MGPSEVPRAPPGEGGRGVIATGLILVLFGLWVVLRTVVKDSRGSTLVDRISNAGGAAA
jgi:hypothetical protein